MMQIFLIFGCPCLLSSFLNPYEGKERDAEREGCFFFPKLIILGFLHLILKPYQPTSISADDRSCIQFYFYFLSLDRTRQITRAFPRVVMNFIRCQKNEARVIIVF